MTTLPYELSKQIMEAGWPQPMRTTCGANFPDPFQDGRWYNWDGKLVERDDDFVSGPAVYSPPLDDLIDGCPEVMQNGEVTGYFFLGRSSDGLKVAGYFPGWPELRYEGKGGNYKEAVTRLWLVLRKDGKV